MARKNSYFQVRAREEDEEDERMDEKLLLLRIELELDVEKLLVWNELNDDDELVEGKDDVVSPRQV